MLLFLVVVGVDDIHGIMACVGFVNDGYVGCCVVGGFVIIGCGCTCYVVIVGISVIMHIVCCIFIYVASDTVHDDGVAVGCGTDCVVGFIVVVCCVAGDGCIAGSRVGGGIDSVVVDICCFVGCGYFVVMHAVTVDDVFSVDFAVVGMYDGVVGYVGCGLRSIRLVLCAFILFILLFTLLSLLSVLSCVYLLRTVMASMLTTMIGPTMLMVVPCTVAVLTVLLLFIVLVLRVMPFAML